MSRGNPAFNDAMAKHLALALADLESGQVEVVPLDDAD